jgi:dipeptidyl aminopeptidase/acylaminoacyl peptidase
MNVLLAARNGRLLVALVLVAALAPRGANAAEPFTSHHVAKLRSVIAAEISPDGRHVAYVLGVPRKLPDQKDGPAWTELHVVDANGNSRPFITGEVDVSAIEWAPDGREITFLTKRGSDEHASLYAIPLAGGEARKLLGHSTAISSYSWSPDGRRLAFLAQAPLPKEKKELRDKGFNQEIYEEDRQPTKVWVTAVDRDAVRPADREQETEKPKPLELEGSASELHWAPQGSHLALALAPTALVDDFYMRRKVRIVDADTGKVVQKIENPGKLGAIAWSPDAKHVAFVSAVDEHDPADGRLSVAAVADGRERELLPGFKGHVEAIAWRDEKTVLYQAAQGVYTTIGEVGIDGKNRKTHVEPQGTIFHSLALSDEGGILALTGDTPRHPAEVFLMKLGGEPRQLTDSNPWLAEMRFGKQEVVRHKARDGLELEGVLVRPLDEKPEVRYPLILAVHGGPEAHVSQGWITSYGNPGQLGASQGFAVFYPNYRGSTGRGVEFSKLGQADAAGKEFDDLIDAVDHLIEMKLVDKGRVGITGGSYGGYASAWGATRYSDRFAASVMFVGISNNVSKVGTTDIPNEMYLVHHFKYLWDDYTYFRERSPLHYVQQAKTPILILHGKEDPRVHPSQSLELYRHLKVLGQTPVRLVLYPGEGHGNRRAASRLDYNLRMMRWMRHYLQGTDKEPPPYEVDYDLPKAEETEKKAS